MKSKPKTWHILVMILLLALLLRLPNLNANFSGDEIDTAGPARHFLIDGDFRQMNECNSTPVYNFSHPPIRQLLYSTWSYVFGFSNVAVRLLSTLFGLASIMVIYFLGKEMYSEKTGIIAAFLATVSRYDIYGSNLVSTDTGHFMFTTSIAVLFFVVYIRRNKNMYLGLSVVFSIISMMTKFSTIILFVPILVAGYLYKKKKISTTYIVSTSLLAMAIIFLISILLNDSNIFYQPISGFITYAQGASSSIQSLLMDKIFKLATISWQMTPFFALLLLVSLFSVKRDKNFWILTSWLVVGFLIIFAQYGQDTQRYFLMMLAPTFLLVARYIENIDFKNKSIPCTAMAIAMFAALIGLNDLMGYYQPIYLAVFYLMAAAFFVMRKYKVLLLVGGFIGLSVYFVFFGNITQINSLTIGELTHAASGYPYKEVWTTKDISYYLTPLNETVTNCEMSLLNKDFIKSNNIKYIAFYTTAPRQSDMENILPYCYEKQVIYSYGYETGFTCKIDTSRI